jgi:hypothetical protein
MIRSLCESCALRREVITPKPVVRCDGYQPNELTERIVER